MIAIGVPHRLTASFAFVAQGLELLYRKGAK
jgi:hypothetical protein